MTRPLLVFTVVLGAFALPASAGADPLAEIVADTLANPDGVAGEVAVSGAYAACDTAPDTAPGPYKLEAGTDAGTVQACRIQTMTSPTHFSNTVTLLAVPELDTKIETTVRGENFRRESHTADFEIGVLGIGDTITVGPGGLIAPP